MCWHSRCQRTLPSCVVRSVECGTLNHLHYSNWVLNLEYLKDNRKWHFVLVIKSISRLCARRVMWINKPRGRREGFGGNMFHAIYWVFRLRSSQIGTIWIFDVKQRLQIVCSDNWAKNQIIFRINSNENRGGAKRKLNQCHLVTTCRGDFYDENVALISLLRLNIDCGRSYSIKYSNSSSVNSFDPRKEKRI